MVNWFDNISCNAFGIDFLNDLSVVYIKILFIAVIILLAVAFIMTFFNGTKLGRAIKYHWKHWERRRRFVRNVTAVCRSASIDIYRKVMR